MNILIVTTEWARFEGDNAGIHVLNQVNRLRQAGLTVDVFPFRGRKNPFAYWQARQNFKKIDISKYDVIHAHHGQAGLIALAQNQRPVVVTFHGSDLQGIRNQLGGLTALGRVLRLSSQWVACRANEIILVADHLAKHIHNRPYHLIPAGVDLNLFHPISMEKARARLGFATNARLILFVGDPERTEKRFWLAKKAVEFLREKFFAQIVIANGVFPEKMPLYMNACNVLLVTSSTEGSPNAIKEALACNLPIVSTDVGDIRQRLDTIEGCVICANDKPETIAKAIAQVFINNKHIDGRNAVQNLDEDILVQKVIAVYQKAIL
ncbi:MAG: glycosyltransferase [Chloroflexi bacterium]|nr:glycosyltransferase [Chloroflexota bacterium]